jgi:hypothetical protein
MRYPTRPLANKASTSLRVSREQALWKRRFPGSGRRRGEPGAVLFTGQSYYHGFYLSRALRRRGWKADVLHFDHVPATTDLYHGHDLELPPGGGRDVLKRHMEVLEYALRTYDVFHFSNAHSLTFGPLLAAHLGEIWGPGADVELLRAHGKKIVYSNNGCLDGVAQSSFARWDPVAPCSACPFRARPDVCSDARNLAWGRFRNDMADLQVTTGGNRADFNNDSRVHEVPEFYCLDPELWDPEVIVPTNYRVPVAASTVKLYHSIGNLEMRQAAGGRNMKGTHVFAPLVERLKAGGHDVELMFFHDVPSRKIRYYQVQADIVLDQLTIGWFGANGRESLMLGKPVVCYLRPSWLEQVARQLPDYVEELPVVNATEETVEEVVRELVENPARQRELGERGRAFALKWHSAEAGARRMDQLYRRLLDGEPIPGAPVEPPAFATATAQIAC